VNVRIGAVVFFSASLVSASVAAEEPSSGIAIEGHVIDATGKPVANALVDEAIHGYFHSVRVDDISRPVRTDENGSFRIVPRVSSMHGDSTTLRVRAQGCVAQQLSVRVDGNALRWRVLSGPGTRATEETDRPIVVTLSAMRALLRGTIIDAEARAPVEGVRVLAGQDEALTDEQGRFRIPLPAGSYPVWLVTPDYSNDVAWVEIADADVEQTFVLRSGRRTLKVRVVDPKGRPVASPRVVLAAGDDGNIEAEREGDADGTVEFDRLSAGAYTAFGYSLVHGFAVQRDLTPDGEPTTMTLSPGVLLKLRVTDEVGLPLVRRRLMCSLVRINEWTLDRPQSDGFLRGHLLYADGIQTDKYGNVELMVPSGRIELDVAGSSGYGRLALDTAKDGDQAIIALGP
jgi:hypothetical protein